MQLSHCRWLFAPSLLIAAQVTNAIGQIAGRRKTHTTRPSIETRASLGSGARTGCPSSRDSASIAAIVGVGIGTWQVYAVTFPGVHEGHGQASLPPGL